MSSLEGFDGGVVSVRCQPSGRVAKVVENSTLMDAVQSVMLPLGRSCDGVSLCGYCRVRVVAGVENLSPVTQGEREILKGLRADAAERLACCARVQGPVTVTTSYW
ncbi:MAG: 2Fe-2S iron-sulfur cluster-binding protein [Acidobacteriota bacterium]